MRYTVDLLDYSQSQYDIVIVMIFYIYTYNNILKNVICKGRIVIFVPHGNRK